MTVAGSVYGLLDPGAGRFKSKSSQTRLKLGGEEACALCADKGRGKKNTKYFFYKVMKHCFIVFLHPSDSIYFPQHFFVLSTFFLLVKMGFVLMSWARY